MTRLCAALITQNSPVGEFSRNLERTIDFVEQSAALGAKIIVFPEMNLTGYATGKQQTRSIGKTITKELTAPLIRLASRLNVTILTGLAEKNADDKIFAAHLVIKPDGSAARYRKIHTAPFEQASYTPGDTINLFESHGIRFGIQLCYDAHFPELSCSMALKGADIIFMPHASPRGTSLEKYTSWLRHLTARAFDNGIYIAACNQAGDNSNGLSFPGVSLFIGPDGNISSKRIDGKEGIHLVEIDRDILNQVRSHKMRYFLPNRRNDLFNLG